MFGVLGASVIAALSPSGKFHIIGFFTDVAIITALCVPLFSLWPQIRFKPAVRTLTIDVDGITTVVGAISGSRRWAEIRSIEQSQGTIVITGLNNNAFVVPERAFPDNIERQQFFESARLWHRGAGAQQSV